MITLKQASLQRGGKILLEAADLTLFSGQRFGITGSNGSGKSSLFKLLLGELQVDSGDIQIPPKLRIAHMAQEVASSDRPAVDYVLDGHKQLRQLQAAIRQADSQQDNDALAKLYSELELIDGYNAQYRAEQLMLGLGFDIQQIQNPVSAFSGGWRIRLNLAQALMSDSDLLLLDEPTNHLDLDATLWLEQWLKRYEGSLMLISHDRDFLDQVVDHIAHIEQQQINTYKGNYSAFERQKAERLSQQQAAYEKQQQRVAEIQRFVSRFKAKASKAKQAQSRVKELARMESIAPAHIDSPFHFQFPIADKFSSPLLNLNHANLGYADTNILTEVNLSLLPGSRIGLLGPNGAGKSTLIKTLVGDLTLQAGERVCGEHLKIGYFAQHQLEALDPAASAFTHLQRLSPTASEQSIRDYLGGFDFRGDRALETITHFSGGEKARLALAIITWQKPNLLLLDEPTNHLDLEMRHALTVALQGFEGALLIVSHDRHLLRNTVDQFWLVANGCVSNFDGDLPAYYQWLQQHRPNTSQEGDTTRDAEPAAVTKVDKKQQRQQAAAVRQQLAPLKKQAQKAEQALEKLEQQMAAIEQQLADSSLYEADNKVQLQALLQQQANTKQQMAATEETWLGLEEQLESLEAELSVDS